jgi:hypothetical protein
MFFRVCTPRHTLAVHHRSGCRIDSCSCLAQVPIYSLERSRFVESNEDGFGHVIHSYPTMRSHVTSEPDLEWVAGLGNCGP